MGCCFGCSTARATLNSAPLKGTKGAHLGQSHPGWALLQMGDGAALMSWVFSPSPAAQHAPVDPGAAAQLWPQSYKCNIRS